MLRALNFFNTQVSQYYKTLFQREYKGIRLFVNFILKLKCFTLSTLRIFHTPHFPHPTFSTPRTPRFPPFSTEPFSCIYYYSIQFSLLRFKNGVCSQKERRLGPVYPSLRKQTYFRRSFLSPKCSSAENLFAVIRSNQFPFLSRWDSHSLYV